MRILTISDVVADNVYSANAKNRFAGVDLVLACGDLPGYYLEFVVSMLDVPLLYVLGNHGDERQSEASGTRAGKVDRQWGEPAPLGGGQDADEEKLSGPAGCVNIDGKVVHHGGLLIAGLEGSGWYNGGPYQYTEEQMGRKILLLRPQLMLNRLRFGRALDILITHAPPAGIHDDTDVAHQGFRAFLRFMDDFAPRYLIHGHKHIYTHGETTVTQYKRTTVINTYGYRCLELEVST